MHIYITGVPVKRFKTPERGRAHQGDSKSYSIMGSKVRFSRGRWRCSKVLSFRAGNCQFTHERRVSRMADYTNAE